VVNITLLPSEAVAGIQIDLLYDATLLTAVSIQEGDFFRGYNTYFHPGVIDNLNGSITGIFNVILQPETGVTDSGVFASIIFKANNRNGSSYLNLDNVLLGNPMAQKILSKQINGTITIQAEQGEPPRILDISLPLYTHSDTITLTCTVTDRDAFNQVNVIITDPHNHQTNTSMIQQKEGNTYKYNITSNLQGAYYLQIWTVDTYGNTNMSISRILMRIHLKKGWNMITVPLQNNFSARSLSQIIGDKCDSIAIWNSSKKDYDSHPSGTHINNFPIKNGMGYYIHLWENVSISISGLLLQPQEISLQKGYNLIGWTGNYKTSSRQLAENITGCTLLAKWDSDMDIYIIYNVDIDDTIFQIETGDGLFVHLTHDTDLFLNS
jgi:hypothetical protein